MNLRNGYRVLFAAYFALFLWLGSKCADCGDGLFVVYCVVMAAVAGWATVESIFRPRW